MSGCKRSVLQLWSVVLCVLIVGNAIVFPAHALEHYYDSDCIAWEFDTDAFCFYIENSECISPNDEVLYCAAALYHENGRMFSSGMSERAEDGSLTVVCTAYELPPAYSIRFFFLDEDFRPVSSPVRYNVSTIAPSCTKNGYVIATSEDGSVAQTIEIIPVKGHSYSDPIIQEPANEVTCGWSERYCVNCTYVETLPVYPECSIARLCMYGDLTGIGKKAEVPITVSFEGEGQDLDCYALLKYQGHTSLVYEKKNYTLKLFKDEQHNEKNKITFFDWNKEHKYILKANYIDSSACRNLVCADIWSEMVACRADRHPRLDDCSNYGATDGFPLALYLNDEFQGLYTFTLHRDDDLFDMEDGNMDGILVTNTAQSEAAFFKAPATFDSDSDWEVEYSGLEDDTLWLEEKLNALIEFVRTASDAEFEESLDEYLDVNSAIDYLIAIYSLGLTNSGAKNITMATYDDGVLFFSLCDMENAFGLSALGDQVLLPAQYLPVCTDGVWDSATNSLLWDRMLQVFYPEICSRYEELRREILTAERICGKVSDYLQPVPEAFYAADKELYPDMPQLAGSHEEQIKAYVTQRLVLLDEIF